ncbi:general substrate transporter [Cylindrobasidium torrendii FP15055 ss-10]|uniref:General substrate transporter n=1 Tax=Cylindrobasidium torrendii FP15055 ss-10 TaxID=1314674 RepID=A0A0D7B1J7_9AGAR|nr:general substrate transporter [Cylindrobasidium torrendii FP15055 ss-10]
MKPFDKPFTIATSRLSAPWLLRGITMACGAGFLLFGFDQGVLGGLLTGRPFEEQFPELVVNSRLQGATVAIYEIGCATGAIFTFFYGEVMGRRRGIIWGMIILSIGAILQFMAYGLPQLIVGRVVTGFGNGMTTSTIPVWHSETSKSHNRGRNVCIELGVNIFGVMLAYWVDFGFRHNETGWQWRFPLSLQIVFALITVFFTCFLPESPRWLASKNRLEEAREVIYMLDTSTDADKRDRSTDVELDMILEAIRVEREAGTSSFADCFRNGNQRFLHRVLLGCGSQMMQQVSGINLITYYAPVIFQKSLGMSRDMSLMLSGFNGLAYFLSSLVPIPLIERLGRRKLMIFGASGQCICMILLAAMTEDVGNKAKGIVAAVCLFAFNFFFSVGWLAIPWLYPAEIAPLQIRAKAAALSTTTNWLFTFLVVMITPVAIDSIAWKTYIVWACTNAAFVPITYFFYVETTGQSLEDIDLIFEGEKGVFLGPASAKRADEIRRRKNQERRAIIEGKPTEEMIENADTVSSLKNEKA